MKVRAENKPTIAHTNRALRKLVASGYWKYQEAVKERGDWCKIKTRRPVRISSAS